MTETINENTLDDQTIADENNTVTEQEKSEKSFSQKEVDRLIQNRLKREKDSFSQKESEWTEKESSYTAQLESFEKAIVTLLESQKDGLTEGERKLLAKLPVLEQIEYLADAKKEKAKMPKLPESAAPKTDSKPSKMRPLF